MCANSSTGRLWEPRRGHTASGGACGAVKSPARVARQPLQQATRAVVPESATIDAMANQTTAQPLEQQLQEIGAQLAWVRDYL
jgi:hypothetical protein